MRAKEFWLQSLFSGNLLFALHCVSCKKGKSVLVTIYYTNLLLGPTSNIIQYETEKFVRGSKILIFIGFHLHGIYMYSKIKV